jgi:hypothetical protein
MSVRARVVRLVGVVGLLFGAAFLFFPSVYVLCNSLWWPFC